LSKQRKDLPSKSQCHGKRPLKKVIFVFCACLGVCFRFSSC
jgi:hypothetical protein